MHAIIKLRADLQPLDACGVSRASWRWHACSASLLTAVINAPARRQLAVAHTAYVTAALGHPPTQRHRADFAAALRALWRVPCANALKMPLWRLAINATPGVHVQPWRCPCDLHREHDQPPRVHAFWDCPVAHGVRAQLQHALNLPLLPRAAVWLLAPPRAGLHLAVWRLVACLALEAMDYGRRVLWARRHAMDWPDPGPESLAALRDTLPAHVVDVHIWPEVVRRRVAALEEVSNLAAARFWHNVHDFASAFAATAPRGFQEPPVPAGHPFLEGTGVGLRAVLPAAFL